jgi:hypothetical protein
VPVQEHVVRGLGWGHRHGGAGTGSPHGSGEVPPAPGALKRLAMQALPLVVPLWPGQPIAQEPGQLRAAAGQPSVPTAWPTASQSWSRSPAVTPPTSGP